MIIEMELNPRVGRKNDIMYRQSVHFECKVVGSNPSSHTKDFKNMALPG